MDSPTLTQGKGRGYPTFVLSTLIQSLLVQLLINQQKRIAVIYQTINIVAPIGQSSAENGLGFLPFAVCQYPIVDFLLVVKPFEPCNFS